MNHGGAKAVAHQFLSQTFGATLGAREDERLALLRIKQLPEHVEFFTRPHFVRLQLHTFSRLQYRSQRNPHWIAHVVMHKPGHRLLQRGRKTQRLPLLRKHRKNAADRRKKAHIQHAVGFVEHQYFNVAQVGELAGHQILQASGRGNHQTRAGAKTLNLRFLGDAADDQSGFRHGLGAQLLVLLVNLHREFARWQENQSGSAASWFVLQSFDQRNQKCQGLSGARLGGADDVPAFKSWRNRAFLDGGKGNKLSRRQLPLQSGRQGQFGKCTHSICFFLEGLVVTHSDTRLELPCRSHFDFWISRK